MKPKINPEKINPLKLLLWLFENKKRSALDGIVLISIINEQGMSPSDIAEQVTGKRGQTSTVDKSLKRLVAEHLVTRTASSKTQIDGKKCTLWIFDKNAIKIKRILF